APEEAALRLRGRPPAVQEQLIGLLQECWFWAPLSEAKSRRWLAEVLRQADADPWRRQGRQALGEKGAGGPGERAPGAAAERQPAAFLVWLGQVLPREQALALLRRAQRQHPGDFWVNFDLAAALYRSVFPGAGEARPARAEELPAVQEAVAFYRVAVGLRPGNASAHTN